MLVRCLEAYAHATNDYPPSKLRTIWNIYMVTANRELDFSPVARHRTADGRHAHALCAGRVTRQRRAANINVKAIEGSWNARTLAAAQAQAAQSRESGSEEK